MVTRLIRIKLKLANKKSSYSVFLRDYTHVWFSICKATNLKIEKQVYECVEKILDYVNSNVFLNTPYVTFP